MKKTACVLTNNIRCELNSLLMSRYKKYFEENGVRVLEERSLADVVVLAGCGFDKANDEQFMGWVEEAEAQLSPEQTLVLAGCWPGMHPDFYREHPRIVHMPLWQESKLDGLFGSVHRISSVVVNRLSEELMNSYSSLFTPGETGDFYISVARGCGNSCSYCMIKKAKGPLTSEPVNSILAQYLEGRRQGCVNFVLISDDFGSFGLDLGVSGPELVRTLHSADPGGRFIINYLFPKALLDNWDEYLSLFRDGIVVSSNIPVQSFSQRILDLMNRHYSVAQLMSKLRELRAAAPKARLVTHCIVGFPTETEEDFYLTVAHAGALFDQATFFEYGDREGTPSHALSPKVTEEEIRARVGALRLLMPFFGDRFSFKQGESDPTPIPSAGIATAIEALGVAGRPSAGQIEMHLPSAKSGLGGASQKAGQEAPGSMEWQAKVVEQRRFCFVTVAVETSLRKLTSGREGPLSGLRPESPLPLPGTDGQMGIALRFTGRDGQLIIHVFPAECQMDGVFRGRQFSASYPVGSLMESPKVLEAVKGLLQKVDDYAHGALTS